jgi:hypothetical protein
MRARFCTNALANPCIGLHAPARPDGKTAVFVVRAADSLHIPAQGVERMGHASAKWLWIVGVTLVCTLTPSRARAQFTPFSDHRSALLEGNWQSCREADGQYAERVFDGRFPGMEPFELHLGPFHEFALFKGIQEDHREHGSAANLLRPHVVELQGTLAQKRWQVEDLVLEVALAGGSRDECESWFVTLKRLDSSLSR